MNPLEYGLPSDLNKYRFCALQEKFHNHWLKQISLIYIFIQKSHSHWLRLLVIKAIKAPAPILHIIMLFVSKLGQILHRLGERMCNSLSLFSTCSPIFRTPCLHFAHSAAPKSGWDKNACHFAQTISNTFSYMKLLYFDHLCNSICSYTSN